jgi:hypothetical protein
MPLLEKSSIIILEASYVINEVVFAAKVIHIELDKRMIMYCELLKE